MRRETHNPSACKGFSSPAFVEASEMGIGVRNRGVGSMNRVVVFGNGGAGFRNQVLEFINQGVGFRNQSVGFRN